MTQHAVAGLTPAGLDHLLVDARAHTRLEAVTGVLLHDGHRFFQYFEGPEAGVARSYDRIRASRMHVALEELQRGPVERLYFSLWHGLQPCRGQRAAGIEQPAMAAGSVVPARRRGARRQSAGPARTARVLGAAAGNGCR